MKRMLVWGVGLVLVIFAGAATYMRTLDHPLETWHVEPSAQMRTGKPNDYLVGAGGDAAFAPRPLPARDLLFLFDAIAMNAPRTTKLAMDETALTATYVQTTRIMAFPDYISVKAVETDKGAQLIIWSRSRFGHSDLGVNRARIEEWLAQMGS